MQTDLSQKYHEISVVQSLNIKWKRKNNVDVTDKSGHSQLKIGIVPPYGNSTRSRRLEDPLGAPPFAKSHCSPTISWTFNPPLLWKSFGIPGSKPGFCCIQKKVWENSKNSLTCSVGPFLKGMLPLEKNHHLWHLWSLPNFSTVNSPCTRWWASRSSRVTLWLVAMATPTEKGDENTGPQKNNHDSTIVTVIEYQ